MEQNSIIIEKRSLTIEDISLLRKSTRWLIVFTILLFLVLPSLILYTIIADYISYSSAYISFFSLLGNHKMDICMFFFMLIAPAVPVYYLRGIIKDIKANSKIIFCGRITDIKHTQSRNPSEIIVLNNEYEFIPRNGVATTPKYSDKAEIGTDVAVHYLPMSKRVFYIKKT